MIDVAIVYQDDKPIRLFHKEKCIYNAYKWCHHFFCLNDYEPKLKLHELPDWLKVKYVIMSEEQFNSLIETPKGQ